MSVTNNQILIEFNRSFDLAVPPKQNAKINMTKLKKYLKSYPLYEYSGFKTKRCRYSKCDNSNCRFAHSDAIISAIRAIKAQNSKPVSRQPLLPSPFYYVPILIPNDGQPITFLPIYPSQPYPVIYYLPSAAQPVASPKPQEVENTVQPHQQENILQLTRADSGDTENLWEELEEALKASDLALVEEA